MKSRINLNNHGFAHAFILLLFVVVFGIAGAYYLVSSRADTVGFTLLGTHPQAAAQPTSVGKTLVTLKGFNNKIYAGFGDYNSNTGPIAQTPFDVATNSFAASPEIVQNTQMVALYRTINGKLYSPSTDIRTSNFAVADLTSGTLAWKEYSWRDSTQQVPFMIHVFDINTLTGTDIWMAGSSNQDGTLFRSTDDGATWTEMQRVVGDSTKFSRFYGVLVLNGKVYVQPMSVSETTNTVLPPETNSRVYSNGVWSKGPNLITSGYNIWHAEQFAGKAVYFTYPGSDTRSSSCLNVFNGSSVSESCPIGGLTDYSIVGDTLYGISYGKVYSTKDLNTWYLQGTGPTNAVSVTAMNGKIYVGTTDSQLYSAPIATAPAPAGSTSGSTGGTKGHGGGGSGGGSTGGACHGKKCTNAAPVSLQ